MKAKAHPKSIKKDKAMLLWSCTLIPILLLPLTLASEGQGGEGDASVTTTSEVLNSTFSHFKSDFDREGRLNYTREQAQFSLAHFSKAYDTWANNSILWSVGLTPQSDHRDALTFMPYVLVGFSLVYLVVSLTYLLIVLLMFASKSFSCVFKALAKVLCCCIPEKSRGERLIRLQNLLDRQSSSREESSKNRYRAQNLTVLILILLGVAFIHGNGVDRAMSMANISLRYFEKDTVEGFRAANKTWLGLKQTRELLGSLSQEVLTLNSSMIYSYPIPERFSQKAQLSLINATIQKRRNETVPSVRDPTKEVTPDFIKNLTPETLVPDFNEKISLAVNAANDLIKELVTLQTGFFSPLKTLTENDSEQAKSLSEDLSKFKKVINETIEAIDSTGSPFNQMANQFFSIQADMFFFTFKVTCLVLVVTLLFVFISTCFSLSNPKSGYHIKSCFVSLMKNILIIFLILSSSLLAASAVIYLVYANKMVRGCETASKAINSNRTDSTIFHNKNLLPLVNACGKDKKINTLLELVEDT